MKRWERYDKEKMERLNIKLNTFIQILLNIKTLSNSSTTKVSCIALKKDLSKIASFGYNGSYSGAQINPETGTEEDSLIPGESGFKPNSNGTIF